MDTAATISMLRSPVFLRAKVKSFGYRRPGSRAVLAVERSGPGGFVVRQVECQAIGSVPARRETPARAVFRVDKSIVSQGFETKKKKSRAEVDASKGSLI